MNIRTLFSDKDQVCFLWSDEVRYGTVGGLKVTMRFAEAQSEIIYSVDTPNEHSRMEVFTIKEHGLFESNAANVAMLKLRILPAIV